MMTGLFSPSSLRFSVFPAGGAGIHITNVLNVKHEIRERECVCVFSYTKPVLNTLCLCLNIYYYVTVQEFYFTCCNVNQLL